MVNKTKILYVCQEMMPYLPESKISRICRNLPQIMQERGREIRTFMPKYGCVNERRNQLHEVIRLSGMNIVIDDTDHQLIIKVASIPNARLQVYFIDNEDFFTRKYVLKDEQGMYFADNDERSLFFARGIIETVDKLRWSPDVIHCHGWFSALMAVYIKSLYRNDPLFASSRIILSLYDDPFTEPLSATFKDKLVLEGFDAALMEGLETPDYHRFIRYIFQFVDGVMVDSEVALPDDLTDLARTRGIKVVTGVDDSNYVEKSSKLYDEIISEE